MSSKDGLSTRAKDIIGRLVSAGLRDRGYENPVTGRRLEAFGRVAGEGRRIVCDCIDAEPGVSILSFVLGSRSDLVVEGALAAAAATGAVRLEFHIAQEDREGATAVAGALAARAGNSPGLNAGVLGVEEWSDHPRVVADDLVASLVRAPFRQNLKGYEEVPTLVIDAETLSCIGRVMREGSEEFRRVDPAAGPGYKLFQVRGGVEKPGIVDIPLGTTLRALLFSHCGGMKEGRILSAVILGGARGACYTQDDLDLHLDFDGVRGSGGSIGTGVVDVLGFDDCLVDQVKRRLGRSCYDECGRCSLGREGSYQLHEIVADMTRGRSRSSDAHTVRGLAYAMREGCACVLGKMVPNLLLSSMDKFSEEYEAHMKRRVCRALICSGYVTYHILPERCDGCSACTGACPEGAIEGGPKKIHVIDQDSCEKCGRCFEICSGYRQAVVKAGPVKPRTPKRPIPVGAWR